MTDLPERDRWDHPARPDYNMSGDGLEWEFNGFVAYKSVALVGNATSLLNQSYGEEIDSHDIVIRMNRVVNDLTHYGQQEQLGHKIDVVFAARPIEAITNGWLWPKYLFWVCGKDELEQRWPEVGNKPICLEQTFRMNWKEQYGMWPTTGLLAFNRIANALWFKRMNVYGFDFFESNSFVTGQNNSAKWHNPAAEKQHVDAILRLNIINKLPPITMRT